MAEVKYELTGLKDVETYLEKLGDVDAIVTTANDLSAEVLRVEIESASPRGETGGLAASVAVTSDEDGVLVSAGDEGSVKYGYNFHATEIGASGGYFTVKQRSRKGNYYNRSFALQDYPYVFTAAANKEQDIIDAYITTLDEIAQQ